MHNTQKSIQFIVGKIIGPEIFILRSLTIQESLCNNYIFILGKISVLAIKHFKKIFELLIFFL